MSIMGDQLALAELIGGGLGSAARAWKENKEEKELFRRYTEILEKQGVVVKENNWDDHTKNSVMNLPAKAQGANEVAGAVDQRGIKDQKEAIMYGRAITSGSVPAIESVGENPRDPKVRMLIEDINLAVKDAMANDPQKDSAQRRKNERAYRDRLAEALVLNGGMNTRNRVQAAVQGYEQGSIPILRTIDEANKAAQAGGEKFKEMSSLQHMQNRAQIHNGLYQSWQRRVDAAREAGYSPEVISESFKFEGEMLTQSAKTFGIYKDMYEAEQGQNDIGTPNLVVQNEDGSFSEAYLDRNTGRPVPIPGSVAADPNKSGTTVTTHVQGPTIKAGLEAAAKGGWKQVEEAHASMKQVATAEALLDEMERVTDFAGKGGSLAPIRLEMMELGQSLGWEMEGLDETQMFKRLQNALALSFRSPEGPLGGLTGNTSDRDIKFLLELPPALTNTPKGRRMAIDMWQKVFSRNREYAKEIEKFYGSEGPGKDRYTTIGWAQHWEDFRNAQDVFDAEDRQKINAGLDRERGVRMAALQKEYPQLDEDDILMMMLDEGW